MTVPPAPAKPMGRPVANTAAGRFVANPLQSLNKLKARVMFMAWVIGGLTAVLLLEIPFAQPIYQYFALNPESKVMRMIGMSVPNMTNRAVLAWSVTSITEVMTMGFGNIDSLLPKQRKRFTREGWEAYSKAFIEGKIGETFKQYQLVLTTVPSNTPVIVSQGVNADELYEWVVQMPVIMTYATNNNVTKKQRGVVTLTIVRVSYEENPFGIAIRGWSLD